MEITLLPANVRYDNNLSPNAKLLYSEIYTMIKNGKKCLKTNNEFATLYNVDKRTITGLIGELNKNHYITVNVVRNEKKQVKYREICLTNK